MNASKNCHRITDYFDIDKLTHFINNNDEIKTNINLLSGNEKDASTATLLKRLYENSIKNSSKKTTQGNRHDDIVKQFASCLLCIVGKGGYELLQSNLGNALPHISTAQRLISSRRKVVEGEFYFAELKEHLVKWNSPLFVNVHLDDTRIINKVEYDSAPDRFVGFCLPTENGLPITNTFQLETFDQIKFAYDNTSIGKYAHCIVVKSINTSVPSFVLFVLCTDSKYDHQIILRRWRYVEEQLQKYEITVISNGADGAGPFLKAMTTKTGLFKRCLNDNVPRHWTFFWMPYILETSLCCQDTIHLLAKLRTRLLTPSNLIILGKETACPGHLQQLLKYFSKSEHGLTQQALQNKDKQNHDSIETLVSDDVSA